MKPSLSVDEQVQLLLGRGLTIEDLEACEKFLISNSYYRFSGYARYFQNAPHNGDNSFKPGTTFHQILNIYEADESLRILLAGSLVKVELLLRTHVARVIGEKHSPYSCYLDHDFYFQGGKSDSPADACQRDIERSKDHHIQHFKKENNGLSDFSALPVWSAVEVLSFGTLSKMIERGANATLGKDVADSLGVARAGFASRVKALVYLRNRCAHHGRLWHHSVLDAGATPNNIRKRSKRMAGQFEPRSILDIVASLDNIIGSCGPGAPILPEIVRIHGEDPEYLTGLAKPESPKSSKREI